jgi:hypothetical protein
VIFVPLTVVRVTVILKEPFLGWRSNNECRLKSSWTRLIRKGDRHRTCTKFRLGVIRRVLTNFSKGPRSCSAILKWVLFETTVTQILRTVRRMKITPLLRCPHHYNLAQVTASLCITVAHCRQSTNFANGPRTYVRVCVCARACAQHRDSFTCLLTETEGA